MTHLRRRIAPLSLFAALAAALCFSLFNAPGASAQAPSLELPPPPVEEGALYLRGDGRLADDNVHLAVDDQSDEARLDHHELIVDDEDGSFEIRAYVIGGDGATATVYVRDREPDGDGNYNVVQQSEIYIGCPEAAECMSASDFHVDAGEGGSWLVDVEYGEGEHGAWQLEVYTEVGEAVLYLPPFPAPPVHAIRGDGTTMADSTHMIVTDTNSPDEEVVRGELIIEDEDGTFEVVAYIEGPHGAVAKVNVYADVADGTEVETRTLEIECPTADICLQTVEFQVNTEPGTYAVDVEHVPGNPDLGPWQLEVYNYVLPAGGFPPGGTGGLFSASGGASSTPVIVLAASVIVGAAALGFALRLRRSRGSV